MFKNNNISKTPLMLFIGAVSIGVLVMIYPVISSNLNYRTSLKQIDDYSANVSENPNKVNDSILENARNYNKKMVGINITNSFSEEKKESADYLSQLDVNGNGIMGYIKIPRIDVEIPIYHGTSSETLQKGVGHLEGSSLPIGGSGTHSILSGHRGLPSSKLFTDLDQLKKDDMFYVYVLDNVLAYKVDQIKIIDPSDTRDLTIVDGKDYITLVTCTPYALNTHRLLVRGEHVEYKEDVLNNIKASRKITIVDVLFYGGLLVAIVIILITIKKIKELNSDDQKSNDNSGNNSINTVNLTTDGVNIMNNSVSSNVSTISNSIDNNVINSANNNLMGNVANISTPINSMNNVNISNSENEDIEVLE